MESEWSRHFTSSNIWHIWLVYESKSAKEVVVVKTVKSLCFRATSNTPVTNYVWKNLQQANVILSLTCSKNRFAQKSLNTKEKTGSEVTVAGAFGSQTFHLFKEWLTSLVLIKAIDCLDCVLHRRRRRKQLQHQKINYFFFQMQLRTLQKHIH